MKLAVVSGFSGFLSSRPTSWLLGCINGLLCSLFYLVLCVWAICFALFRVLITLSAVFFWRKCHTEPSSYYIVRIRVSSSKPWSKQRFSISQQAPTRVSLRLRLSWLSTNPSVTSLRTLSRLATILKLLIRLVIATKFCYCIDAVGRRPRIPPAPQHKPPSWQKPYVTLRSLPSRLPWKTPAQRARESQS